MLFKAALYLALVTLAVARPNPSSLKTIASSTGAKSSIKSPSQKLAEKNNSPSVASIIELQSVGQTEALSASLPQSQDSDAALQYSQDLVQQASKVVPTIVKENQKEAAASSVIQNEVVKPATYSNIVETVQHNPVQPVDAPVQPVQPAVVAAVVQPAVQPVVQPVAQPVVQPAVVQTPVQPVVVVVSPVQPVVNESPIQSVPSVASENVVSPVVAAEQSVPVVNEAPVQPIVNDAPIQPIIASNQESSIVSLESKPVVSEAVPATIVEQPVAKVEQPAIVHSPPVLPSVQVVNSPPVLPSVQVVHSPPALPQVQVVNSPIVSQEAPVQAVQPQVQPIANEVPAITDLKAVAQPAAIIAVQADLAPVQPVVIPELHNSPSVPSETVNNPILPGVVPVETSSVVVTENQVAAKPVETPLVPVVENKPVNPVVVEVVQPVNV